MSGVRTILAWISITLSLAITDPVGANPVRDDVADAFRDLVATTGELRRCPDAEQLSRYFEAFGLDLLSGSDVSVIRSQFDVFAPILARSQETDGALHFEIQELYRDLANSEQRDVMIKALRSWLTDDIREAPRHGTMQTAGPESAVRREIDRARATAAEMLVDWGDRESDPLMADLQTKIVDKDARRIVDTMRLRLVDPCAGRLVALSWEGPVLLCARRDQVAHAYIYSAREKRSLSSDELDRLWELLPRGRWDSNSGWASGINDLEIETIEGLTCRLSLTEPGRLPFTETSTLNRRLRRTMNNPLLFEFVEQLAQANSP